MHEDEPLPHRLRIAAIAALTLVASVLSSVPVGAVAAPQKVVIIVGPVGTGTDHYRDGADETAAAAEAAGATVVKVYSPNATWANVKAAVEGANIVIYMGHGNGWPSPYSSTQSKDRVNGWGLNRVAGAGDGDNWSSTMVYCGEKAITGTLTSSDGSAQWQYCGGSTNTDGINPAPNWVMIYGNACYAPGASESWDTPATESIAYERVRNYARPALAAGASAYYASDLGTADLVTDILQNPSLTWTDITRMKQGYDNAAQRHFAHPDVSGAEVWIQATARWGGGGSDYLFAFAGNPLAKPEGGFGTPLPYAPVVVSRYPASGATGVALTPAVAARFDQAVTGVSPSSFVLRDPYGNVVPATVTYRSDQFRAQLVPSAPLAYGTRYTAHLGSAIENSAGLSMTPASWSFTTLPDPAMADLTAPTVVSLSPGAGTWGNSMFSSASVRFNEAMTGLGPSSMLLRVDGTSTNVATWVSYDPATFTARLTPKSPLLPNTRYRISFTSAVTDLGGNHPAYFSWTFKTRSAEAFNPAKTLQFSAGTYTGYKFSSTGAVQASKPVTLSRASNAPATSRSAITAQTGGWYYISAGVWAGYWIKDSGGIKPL